MAILKILVRASAPGYCWVLWSHSAAIGAPLKSWVYGTSTDAWNCSPSIYRYWWHREAKIMSDVFVTTALVLSVRDAWNPNRIIWKGPSRIWTCVVTARRPAIHASWIPFDQYSTNARRAKSLFGTHIPHCPALWWLNWAAVWMELSSEDYPKANHSDHQCNMRDLQHPCWLPYTNQTGWQAGTPGGQGLLEGSNFYFMVWGNAM